MGEHGAHAACSFANAGRLPQRGTWGRLHAAVSSERQPSGAPCSALHACTLDRVAWTRDTRLQGMLPAIAPVLAHMAEDAWEHLPWSQPRRSVFEAGWFQAPQEWHQMPEVRQLSAVCYSQAGGGLNATCKAVRSLSPVRMLNGPSAGLP